MLYAGSEPAPTFLEQYDLVRIMDRTMGRPEESALEREAFRNIHVMVSDTIDSEERSGNSSGL